MCSLPDSSGDGPRPTPAQQLSRFKEWATWARSAPGLTAHQRKLALGPETFHNVYDRATVNGIAFTCELLESKKKSKDSIIMIRLEGADGAAGAAGEPGAPGAALPTMFGRVQAFVEVVRPGLGFGEPGMEMVQYVDATWYKPPRLGTPCLNKDIGCPVVQKETHPPLEHGLWPADQIVPVSIALAPYIRPANSIGRPTAEDAKHWQVLAADPDFLTRDYVPRAAAI